MKTILIKKPANRTLTVLSFVIAACAGVRCAAETLPASTALPVEFTSTIEAGKAAVNDPVRARTMQIVLLPNGEQIPKGSIVSGRVVESKPFVFNPAAYEEQKPSVLGIRFDKVEAKNATWDTDLSVRAIANVSELEQAETPYSTVEYDWPGTMIQIGGDHYDPPGRQVYSPNGDIVGYKRRQGVFAKLISDHRFSENSTLGCDSTTTEQSVAVFSAGACGLYGFADLSMTDNGANDGTIRLESAHHTVKLYSHSGALLEEINPPQAQRINTIGQ